MRKLGEVEWEPDRRGDLRWRVRFTNSKIGADSGEGYVRAVDARKGKLAVTKVLVADLTDEEFYAAAAYRSAVRAGMLNDPEPPAITPDPE